MDQLQELTAHLPEIESKIAYAFVDKNLLISAFVHRSFYNEHRESVPRHNERLEFLGDSVLGLLISDFLYGQLPEDPEGRLSNLRSHIVEASSCASLLAQLGLGQFVLLGKGERMNDGRGRETILADLFEAIIGAIYLDGGIEAARSFVFTHFETAIREHLNAPARNWKAELQDYSQKKHQRPPTYKIAREMGPDHSKLFEVEAWIGETQVGKGTGSSKKEAEQAAAADAMRNLEEV